MEKNTEMDGGVDWIDLAEDRNKRRAVVLRNH
jgi:hypothetical protein